MKLMFVINACDYISCMANKNLFQAKQFLCRNLSPLLLGTLGVDQASAIHIACLILYDTIIQVWANSTYIILTLLLLD